MTEKSKKLSRRDAIKILAAATGAGVLANIPSKWIKPGMAFGVLPAHAQGSVPLHTLAAGADATIESNVGAPPITIFSTVEITPSTPEILMRYSIAIIGVVDIKLLNKNSTGTVATDGSGTATLPITYSNLGYGSTITVIWSFENPSDGTGSDDQIFNTPAAPIHTLAAGADDLQANFCWPFTSTVTITPPTEGIVLRYDIVTGGIVTVISPNPLSGTLPTDAAGMVSLEVTVDNMAFGEGDTVTVTWSFEDPADGSGNDEQIFTSAGGGC
jgi:hypothetical protein